MEASPPLTFKNRSFTPAEISLIEEVVGSCPGLSHQELANTICELLGWHRPNGGLKTWEARDLLYARSAFVCSAAAAGGQAVDGVWPDIQDAEGLKTFALQSRRLGFTGMSSIHPSQIDAINAAFTPSAEEVEYCRKVVQAFDEARSRGEGSIAFGGQLIDLPIVERARRTLALAASLLP